MGYTESNRRWGTLVFVGVVAVFAAIIFWGPLRDLIGGQRTPAPGSTPAATVSPNSVVVEFHSAITKEDWVNAVTASFNAAGHKTRSGMTIVVQVKHVTSGGSKNAIVDGTSQPTAWSPGDQSWADQANQVWRDRTGGSPLVSGDCPPTVYAPIGFAMWEPMAEAMGWPDQPIGWGDIVALAADPRGWERYGQPELGNRFQFGHPHAVHSNFGMLMVAEVAQATLGLTEGLTPNMVWEPEVVNAMRHLELHTFHYGVHSRNLLDLMARRGPSYLHAVFTSESETLKANVDHVDILRYPLVFVFPAEGTYWTEQPYCVLDGADWVSDEEREAADIYGAYLLQPERQALAVDFYLRPVASGVALHCPICLDQGTDPAITQDIVPALESPTADTSQALIELFLQTKRKASVVLVLDRSSSMAGEKITNAVEAAAQFIERLEPEDEVLVITFNDAVNELQAPGQAGDISETLAQTVRTLYASGGTALYDALCQAHTRLSEMREINEEAGDPRLYGIVVLSDGKNSSSLTTETQMFIRCLPSGDEVEDIKVFTIAYGGDADTDLLVKIANHTGGRYFVGDPATIATVYTAISAEQ